MTYGRYSFLYREKIVTSINKFWQVFRKTAQLKKYVDAITIASLLTGNVYMTGKLD